jgi:hypothetical protein
MSLNIKNTEVENLAGEVAALMGVNKTEAIRQAPEEKNAFYPCGSLRPTGGQN